MKARPYVYKLTHRETGEYYLGYREANTVHAHQDLGVVYFSSGAITKKHFDDFLPEIIAEFDTGDEAYDFEQKIIRENRKDVLLLNRRYDNGDGLRFVWRGPHTEETRRNISASLTGRRYTLSDDVKKRMSEAAKKRPHPSDETRKKLRDASLGRKHSEETKAKIAASHAGREYPTPSLETKQKMSEGQKKTWTDEKRKHRSELNANRSEETRKKLSESNKGKKRSEETKRRMSEAAKRRHATKQGG